MSRASLSYLIVERRLRRVKPLPRPLCGESPGERMAGRGRALWLLI